MAWQTISLWITGRQTEAADLNKATACLNETMPAKVSAKGDVCAGLGANSLGVLAVGDDDGVLQADSGETTGLVWQGDLSHTHT